MNIRQACSRLWHALRGWNDRAVNAWMTVLFLLLVVVLSVLFAVKQHGGSEIFSLGFVFGSFIRSVVEEGRYGIPDSNYGYWAYAQRMPFLPVMIAFLFKVTQSLVAVSVIKNLVFWALWLYGGLKLVAVRKIPYSIAWPVLFISLLIPLNANTAFALGFEEGLIYQVFGFLACQFFFAKSRLDYWLIGASVFALYLTKSSMAVVCCVVAVSVLFDRSSGDSVKGLIPVPLGFFVLAVVGWGLFIQSKTGVFAVGSDASSWNGWNLYKANNHQALDLYPDTSLDVLDKDGGLLPSGEFENEWATHKAQKDLGSEYIKAHPDRFFKMVGEKLEVVFFSFRNTPGSDFNPQILATGSAVLNQVIFASAIILSGLCLLRKKLRSPITWFSVCVAGYFLPYMVGFVYHRHCVPVYAASALVLMPLIQALWFETASEQTS